MSLGKALVLCLMGCALCGVVATKLPLHSTGFKVVQAFVIGFTFLVFMAWIRASTVSLEADIDARVSQALEPENEQAEPEETTEEEERRLRRNARQRERRAEMRARERGSAVIQEHLRREEVRAVRKAGLKTSNPPAPTVEPKSRWDRLLEDDDED